MAEQRINREGLEIIKNNEKLHLEAYRDAVGVPTIGWGHTGGVKMGQKLASAAEAEKLLAADLNRFEKAISNLVKVPLNENQFSALVSLVFNIGEGEEGFAGSTLLKKLNARDYAGAAAQFTVWNKGEVDGKLQVLPGLVRRRAEEQALFNKPISNLDWKLITPPDNWQGAIVGVTTEQRAIAQAIARANGGIYREVPAQRKAYLDLKPPAKTTEEKMKERIAPEDKDLVLQARYFSQRDSATGHALRMCKTSSVATMLTYLKPNVLTKSANADDELLARVFQYGDTTDPNAQIQALKHFGIQAQFRQNLGWVDVFNQLENGIPVTIDILHHGTVDHPSGGGHTICVVGKSADESVIICHDPYGEMDLVNGVYISNDGAFVKYSKKNLGKRWLIEGDKSGWGIIAKKP